MNLGGLIKDCVVFYVVKDVEERGFFCFGGIVVEGIVGNIGIGFVYVCWLRGYKLVIYMFDIQFQGKIDLLWLLGVEVYFVFVVVFENL